MHPQTGQWARIAINKLHYPVTVLGPGQRIGIWVQGCSIGCKGCVSRDTWVANDNHRIGVDELLAWCKRLSPVPPDGVTISGGEPFEQAEALAQLLQGLHDWRQASGTDFDILCYSGHPLSVLRRRHAGLLAQLDALIAGPYVQSQPSAHPWFGSANQELAALSPRGRRLYPDVGLSADPSRRKRMQMLVDGDHLWFVGIPARGDMDRLEALCRARGVDFKQVSWRS